MLGPDVGLYCLEVGKGASAAVVEPIPGRTPAAYQATVVDVGEKGVRLAQWLRTMRVDRIPAILLTHNDSDHVGSLAALVEAYKTKIGKLRFGFDRRSAPSFWAPLEDWRTQGWIQSYDMLGTPAFFRPGAGELVVGADDDVGFRLYCVYPPRVWQGSFLTKLKLKLKFFFGGKNRLSAVLRLTPSAGANPTLAIFGGDLDYKGWQHLADSRHDLRTQVFLVPHHGGPQRRTAVFGESQLAGTTHPRHALISVGTNNADGHPHADLVRAFRAVNATVLCTQVTQQCLPATRTPASLPNESLLKRAAQNNRLCPTGSACAGTIIVQFLNTGPKVLRLNVHQAAVNQVQASGHNPLCRP